MPTCKKCHNHFPNRLHIDNKTISLYKRKYCLDCSPYGKHNTKKLENPKQNDTSAHTCKKCNRKYIYERSKGHRVSICNSCVALKRKNKIKAMAIEYKGGKCSKCGYSKCIDVLSFHHMDSAEKDFTIAGNYNRSWTTIKNEIDKCILLCMNCHIEHHSSE